MRVGTRMRRRRRAGVSIAAAAAIAVVAGGSALVTGGIDASPAAGGGFASEPSAVTSSPGDACTTTLTVAPGAIPSARTALEPGQCVTASGPAIIPESLPVSVADLQGPWACGIAADEKIPCRSGTHLVSIDVRPLSELAAWSGGDPDRPHSQVAHVGSDYFVTVQPGPGTPKTLVTQLRGGLVYERAWHPKRSAAGAH
jgi:hypothetical protein